MESLSSERRGPNAVRMPVTMSVELAHEGYAESFEADALNVSASGLGLRSAMLPDVGQRMTCRFAMPDMDVPLEAEGEVVWASDAGLDAGEFGLRFDALEPRIEESLARWVASLEDAAPATPRPKARTGVRVQLDGVATPIDAEIAMRTTTRLRVEQPLPFLALGTGASALGERRVLRAVELRVEANIPRLVLELEGAASAESTAADQALEELMAPRSGRAEPRSDVHADDSGDDLRAQDDSGDDLRAQDDSGDDLRAPAPRAVGERVLVDRRPPAVLDDAPLGDVDDEARASVRAVVKAPKKSRRDDEARAVSIAHDREVSVESLVASAGLPDPEDPPSLGERLVALRTAAGPALGRALASIRAGWAVVVASAGPRARAIGAAILAGVAAISSALREKAPGLLARFRRTPKRRTTTAPPAATREPTAARRQVKEAPVVVASPRVPARAIVAGVLAIAAVGIVVRAVASGEPEVDAVPVHAALPVEAEPVLMESEPATLEPAAEPSSAAEPATTETTETPPVEVSLADVTASLPGAMPEPTTEAGRLSEPTFPTVGAAADPATATPAEPTVVDDDGDLIFGAAEVPHGRVTTLRMSLPVTALEGESDSTGFTVTLHGALSLDRAGPIAAANPSVERAAILNRGDHAVLTVRFVAGRTPAYRVEATGSSVSITIGR